LDMPIDILENIWYIVRTMIANRDKQRGYMITKKEIIITADDIKTAMKVFEHTQVDAAVEMGIGLRTLIRRLHEPGILIFRHRSIARTIQMYINESRELERTLE